MSTKENLTCKSINELTLGENSKKFCFHIPTYQRGYRWEEEEVKKLLEDLDSFFKAKEQSKTPGSDCFVGEFYCLQPITVVERDILEDEFLHYEVIDGQQRLTTIYILLQTLGHQEDCFRICFDRDQGSDTKEREDFLLDIANQKEPEAGFSRVDYFFMYQAYDTINKWKDNYKNNKNNKSIHKLLGNILDDVKVIWYELAPDKNPREVFRHINDGKLPLTDSELVKAMLLSSNRFAKEVDISSDREKYIRIEQEQIARLWDEMEHMLHRPLFWTFIYPHQQKMSTHLDFLFDLVRKQLSEAEQAKENLIIYFERILSDGNQFSVVWDKAREIFRTLQDWYENPLYYHLIGYLTNYAKIGIGGFVQILDLYGEKSKAGFRAELKGKIRKYIKISESEIDSLSYDSTAADKRGKADILNVLVLFNALETNALGNRFIFQPSDDVWSVEHIFAQSSQLIKDADQIGWLQKYKRHIEITQNLLSEEQQSELEESKLLERIDLFTSGKEGGFEELFMEILNKLETPGSEIDSICNFALISKTDNSILSNSPFYEKREKVLGMHHSGKHIPQGTVNVFTKAYTKAGAATNLDYWSADDGERYKSRIAEVIKDYLTEDNIDGKYR